MSTPLREAAAAAAAAGLCVIPIRGNRKKAPLVPWTPYKVTASTPEEHDEWFGPTGRAAGIAVVYGAVSGGVEMLEFEGRAVEDGTLDEVGTVLSDSGLGDVWDAITTGWVTRSPSGGLHFRMRPEGEPVAGNTRLAARLAREDEWTPEERQRVAERPGTRIERVLVETRGEGGYGIIEPSDSRVHPSGGAWELVAGGPSTIPTVPADMASAVRDVCRMMDTLPKRETARTAPRDPRPAIDGVLRPGDDYEARADWADVLRGTFRPTTTRGRTTYWQWADGVGGVKATTGRDPQADRLYVFATGSELLSETPYSKFGAYAALNFGGDHKAAAAELRRQGYGSEPPRRRLAPVPVPAPRTDGSAALDVAPGPEDDPWAGDTPDLRVVTERPQLEITNEADALDGVLKLMEEGKLPDLYKRSGGPCWIYEDDEGQPLVQQLGTDNLRAYMADHVTTYAVRPDTATGGVKEERELLQPKTCGTILGRRDWPLPRLRGIITAPVVRPSGTVITATGYDRETGLYLHPRVPMRRLAPTVTDESLARAKDVVFEHLLVDLPFVADSDRAHYLALLVAPIIRHLVPGPTPLWIITGTAAGSGKTLMKDVPGELYGLTGMPWPENDAEMRKAVTAKLIESGAAVIAMDNLPSGHIVKSPLLSNLVTTGTWSDRLLGASSTVSVPNDRCWVLTGNNIRTSGDNRRRTLFVRLDPGVPRPDQRGGFKVGDLRTWLRANASTVVAALVTMVRSWLAAGAPRVDTRMGDYSAWASTVAGILQHLGVNGWLGDRDDITAMDDEAMEWTAFLIEWAEKIGTTEAVPAKALLALKETCPQLANGDAPSAKQLGHWLKAKEGRYFEDLKIIRVPDSHRKINLWRVERHQPGRTS
ncbi:hypothetical protein [Streptomyces bohaiensis]|uniref:hypothetical protein n=1 Tax=Streptomyces bohaiensis TaxID=1431344 RepID=UPI003B782E6B